MENALILVIPEKELLIKNIFEWYRIAASSYKKQKKGEVNPPPDALEYSPRLSALSARHQ